MNQTQKEAPSTIPLLPCHKAPTADVDQTIIQARLPSDITRDCLLHADDKETCPHERTWLNHASGPQCTTAIV